MTARMLLVQVNNLGLRLLVLDEGLLFRRFLLLGTGRARALDYTHLFGVNLGWQLVEFTQAV